MKMIEKLIVALDRKGWTQGALESHVGLSANRISKWKDGQGQPTAKQALAIARALEMPLEYLVDDDLEEESEEGGAYWGQRVAEVVRMIGPEEAWRRLLLPPSGMTREQAIPPGQAGMNPLKLVGKKQLPGSRNQLPAPDDSGADPVGEDKPVTPKGRPI